MKTKLLCLFMLFVGLCNAPKIIDNESQVIANGLVLCEQNPYAQLLKVISAIKNLPFGLRKPMPCMSFETEESSIISHEVANSSDGALIGNETYRFVDEKKQMIVVPLGDERDEVTVVIYSRGERFIAPKLGKALENLQNVRPQTINGLLTAGNADSVLSMLTPDLSECTVIQKLPFGNYAHARLLFDIQRDPDTQVTMNGFTNLLYLLHHGFLSDISRLKQQHLDLFGAYDPKKTYNQQSQFLQCWRLGGQVIESAFPGMHHSLFQSGL